MKYCPSCGKAGVEGMKFCPRCGQKLMDFDLEVNQRYVQKPERHGGKMRKAAGIILIVFGITLLSIHVDLFARYDYLPVIGLPFGILIIIWTIFTITGGVLCLKRKYWGLCLASALVTVFVGIIALMGSLLGGGLSMNWVTWSLIVGGIISTILISGTKGEWQ